MVSYVKYHVYFEFMQHSRKLWFRIHAPFTSCYTLLFMYVHTKCDRDFTSDGPSRAIKEEGVLGYLTNTFETVEKSATPH